MQPSCLLITLQKLRPVTLKEQYPDPCDLFKSIESRHRVTRDIGVPGVDRYTRPVGEILDLLKHPYNIRKQLGRQIVKAVITVILKYLKCLGFSRSRQSGNKHNFRHIRKPFPSPAS